MDYDALAAKFGGADHQSAVDYDQLAVKFGGSDGATTQPETSIMQDIGQGAGDLAAGMIRGAGSIGATLLAPWDMGKDFAAGKGLSLDSNRERRAEMDFGLRELGANPDSAMYATGKLGSEIAGTAGIGGVLAKGVMGAGAAIPKLAPYAPKLAAALESGGFRLNPSSFVGPAQKATLATKAGDMALRTGAGAAVGGAAAGAIDPEHAGAGAVIGGAIPGGVKIAGAVGGAARDLTGMAARNIAGQMTGAGGEALRTAYQSGKSGAQSFVDNMRGNVPLTDVLNNAKGALANMRAARGAEYRSGMLNISADKTILDINPIVKMAAEKQSLGSYKGQVINKNAASVVDDVTHTVREWAKLNPSEYHTPEGLDALKQAIGDIADSVPYGTKARNVVDGVYHAIKKQIADQAPVYSKVMKSYSEASATLNEIERAMSLGNKSSADASMRKLQSLMRNNVNTNYGNRLNLARELEQKGGGDIIPSIAGQALNSPTPRGLQGLAATGTTIAGLLNPAFLMALPAQSPRLMGEAFYGAGRLRNLVGRGADGVASNPAIANTIRSLPGKSTYQPLMTIAPSVAMSR